MKDVTLTKPEKPVPVKKAPEVTAVKPRVIIAALVAALGGLVFGWDVGGSGGTFVMPAFREVMGWGPLPTSGGEDPRVSYEQGLITALFSVGALCGALPSGFLADKLGRRRGLITSSFVFTVGTILMASAQSTTQLCSGRYIAGFAVGNMSMMVGLYQSELAPEHIRGTLVTLLQLSITFGIFLASIINVPIMDTEWGWRLSYGGNGIISLIMFFAMFFMPESPRWLMQTKQEEEAKRVMPLIREVSEGERELLEIKQELEISEAEGVAAWKDLVGSNLNMGYRLFCGMMIMLFQQLTGINAIMYFAPSILSSFLGSHAAMWANVALMGVNFFATFICIGLIDRAGRRAILLTGGAFLTLFTACVSLMSSPLFVETEALGYIIVTLCACYVACFAYSWGPVPWIACAEIFPNKYRGKAMSISTFTNWSTNLVIAQVSPILYNPAVLNLYGTFAIFSCCCAIMFAWVYFCLPEANGKTLEEMDSVFEDFRASSKVPFVHREKGEKISAKSASKHQCQV